MSAENTSLHGEWSSQLGFILAATGSAVGLGNIWKFPFLTGSNGGGAFVIVYLLCVLLICMPIMMAEILLGKRGRSSPINTMRNLAREYGHSTAWQILGWSGVLAGFLILSYYSVIAGWALAYVPQAAMGTFEAVAHLPQAEVVGFVSAIFDNLVADPWKLLFWHTMIILFCMVIVVGGIQGGLERALRFMMPTLFLLLLILLGYAMSTPKFMEGVHFMFDVDFDKLFYPNCTEFSCEFSGQGILAAMGQAFFSLSLGMGAIMVYGAYLPKTTSITQVTTIVVISDTVVALLAGLVIFPIVFSHGLQPDQGPNLVFNTLTVAFGKMSAGNFFGTLFFILLVLAAVTSAISLIEPTVAWLIETGRFSRISATIFCGLAAWLLGFLTVFSFNIWKEVRPLTWLMSEQAVLDVQPGDFVDKTWFDVLDFLTSNVMLPLGGLLIALFTAWFLGESVLKQELALGNRGYRFWRWVLRYVAPIGVGLIFLNAIGLFS